MFLANIQYFSKSQHFLALGPGGHLAARPKMSWR